jgi:hypothetical protein
VVGEEFSLTLEVSGGGDGRAVVGAEAGTIRLGKIRNVVQVIVADEAGTIVAFEQVRRGSNNSSGAELSVKVQPGAAYHFLVLMGYQPYSDFNAYTYTYDTPTLLAAGFTTATVTGPTSITVEIKPVVVDTSFSYGGTGCEAALGGVTLPLGVDDAEITWKVTSGFAPLIAAQNAVSGDFTA